MSHGRWGGRLPLGNLFVSWIVFNAASCRLASLLLKNRLKGQFFKRALLQQNTDSARTELARWVSMGYTKLNVGGGSKNLRGFVNIDFARHPSVEREIVANVLDLSFVESRSISHVHTNHVLEHFDARAISNQLHEYFRILTPGGLLTVRAPSALGAAYGFWFPPELEGERAEFVKAGFPEDEIFCDPRDFWMHRDFYAVLHWFHADVGNPENEHLTLITPTWLKERVIKAGFVIEQMSVPEALNVLLVARKPK